MLNWENLGDRVEAIIDGLRDYAGVRDRTARSEAAEALGNLLVEIDETARADAATRPGSPAGKMHADAARAKS